MTVLRRLHPTISISGQDIASDVSEGRQGHCCEAVVKPDLGHKQNACKLEKHFSTLPI